MCRKPIHLVIFLSALGLVSSAAGQGLQGEYFNNMMLSGPAVLTRVEVVDFDWGDPGSPAPSVNVDQFSARWTGGVMPLYSENYIFHTRTDDGVRLWVDDRLLINNWADHSPTWDLEFSGTVTLLVTDNDGRGSIATASVVVTAP